MKLKEEGPHAEHNDGTLGKRWHALLGSDVLSKKKVKGEKLAAKELVQSLQEQFGVKLLDCNFPLYGYVYNKEETAPNIYLWQDAEADAIGWYYDKISKRNKFVIVDWKVCDLLEFWKKSTTYGMYLHQGLVSARLLQLHMKLDYLPPILLVPISFRNGQDIQPGFFYDYPDECKDAVNRDVWSTTLPKPPLVIQPKMPFKPSLKDGEVDGEMLLKDLIEDGAKVKDFLKFFEHSSLQVRRNRDEMELEWLDALHVFYAADSTL